MFDDLDKYKIKIIKENNLLLGSVVWHLIDKTICYIDFIILKKQIQHQGYCRKLLNFVVEFAKNNNCNTIECEAIDVFGKINSKNLLESSGFVEQYEIKNYWGDLYPDFDCKECGHKCINT